MHHPATMYVILHNMRARKSKQRSGLISSVNQVRPRKIHFLSCLSFFFIEKDPARCQQLTKELKKANVRSWLSSPTLVIYCVGNRISRHLMIICAQHVSQPSCWKRWMKHSWSYNQYVSVICIKPAGVRLWEIAARVCYSPAGPVSLLSVLLLDSVDTCFVNADLSFLWKDKEKMWHMLTLLLMYTTLKKLPWFPQLQ